MITFWPCPGSWIQLQHDNGIIVHSSFKFIPRMALFFFFLKGQSPSGIRKKNVLGNPKIPQTFSDITSLALQPFYGSCLARFRCWGKAGSWAKVTPPALAEVCLAEDGTHSGRDREKTLPQQLGLVTVFLLWAGEKKKIQLELTLAVWWMEPRVHGHPRQPPT